MDRLYLALSTLCFLGGFAYVIVALRTGDHRPSRWNLAAMVCGFIFQNLFLYERGLVHKRCPITSVIEILIFICWAMVLIYLLFGTTYRLSLLGFFTSPLVFIVQLAGVLMPFDREAAMAEAAARGPANAWVEFHVSVSLLAYGAFAMAFVAGVMFLVQDRQIRKHNLKALFYNLPPIHNLSKAIMRLMIVGFALLSAGILSAYKIEETPTTLKLVFIYGVWGLYGILLAVQVVRGMAAKSLARSSVAAFALPLVSLWVMGR